MRHGPTIYDVARKSGVAASTVSRVFSNPARVSLATRELVQATATEIGYTPRPLARAESPRRARMFTLVVTDIANPYYAPLIKAAQAEAGNSGYTLSLVDSDESPRLEASNLRKVLATASAGILATSRLPDETIQQLARYRPLVVINREIDGIPSLIADTAGGMRKAVRHLATLGHRDIAYVSGPRNSWVNSIRWNALHDEAVTHGLHADLLGPFPPTRQGGGDAADALILQRCTAAVTYNDLMAIGTLQSMTTKGVDVPGEFSLIGCDDIFGSDLTVPALTTITGPTDSLGRHAVRLAHSQLSTHATPDEITSFDTHLVIRGSTGPPAEADTAGN